jgi:hypothetical protein
MHWIFSAETQMTLLVASLAATCVAAALLACEFLGSRRSAQLAPGLIGAALAGLAIAFYVLSQPIWFSSGCGFLGGLLLMASLLHLEGARTFIKKCVQPRAAWVILLCLSVLASRFLAASVLNAVDGETSRVEIDLADAPVLTTQAMTDEGRSVSLFHFKMHSTSTEIEQFIEQSERDHRQLIRLLAANPASNCHGWVFTGGQYGVRDSEVSLILTDHEYLELTQPADGDLAVYRRAGQICHSGLVRLPHKQAPALIESKWGPLGVYLHAIDEHPFGGTCCFYRSPRPGHSLMLQPASSGRPTATLAAPAALVD